MAKKRSLLDALKDRQVASAKTDTAVEAASGAGQLMQAAGTGMTLASGPIAIVGAVINLGGMFLGYTAASFQTKRMRQELEFIAESMDKLPEKWATDGTLEEHILPAIVKHMAWRAQETHEQKIEAARNHLRRKMLDGTPTPERYTLHQHVEKFLNDCTVSELVLFVKADLVARIGGIPRVQIWTTQPDPYLQVTFLEEELCDSAGVEMSEGDIAISELLRRRLLMKRADAGRNRSHIGDENGNQLGGTQRELSMTSLGRRVAELLRDANPPAGEGAEQPRRKQ